MKLQNKVLIAYPMRRESTNHTVPFEKWNNIFIEIFGAKPILSRI
jgi:hypothetical protein